MNPIAFVLAYARRLRFPQLFALVLTLFLVDVVVPDVIPFVDELLLGLGTLLLGSMRRTTGTGDDDPRSARSRARSTPR